MPFHIPKQQRLFIQVSLLLSVANGLSWDSSNPRDRATTVNILSTIWIVLRSHCFAQVFPNSNSDENSIAKSLWLHGWMKYLRVIRKRCIVALLRSLYGNTTSLYF
jgi:hypothetical protein